MAERRMFAKTIIDSDAFLDMPMSARLLYYDLGMRADDDGFINSPKKIMRMIGATNDDMNILIARKFVIPFESGVVVIKAWRINNYLRSDRYNKTKYVEEKSQLVLDENGMYHSKDDNGIPLGIPLDDTGKDRLGKDSIGKDSIYTPSIISPTENPKPKSKSSVNADIYKMLDDSQISDSVKESVSTWLKYKSEQFKFSYKPTGFKAFLTEIYNNELSLGAENVCKAISLSMGKGYKGIIWDLVKKEQPRSSAYMDAIKNRVSIVDSWE